MSSTTDQKLDTLIAGQQQLTKLLLGLTSQGGWLMTISQQMLDTLNAIDSATNSVAAEVQDLSNQISTGMTPAEVETLQARLNGVATKLASIAADPNNPVPPAAAGTTTGATTSASTSGGAGDSTSGGTGTT